MNRHPVKCLPAPDGRRVGIDVLLVPLIEALWAAGYQTVGCCQDIGESLRDHERESAYRAGYVLLEVPVEDACRLLDMVKVTPQFKDRMHWAAPGAWSVSVPVLPFGLGGAAEPFPWAQIYFPAGQLGDLGRRDRGHHAGRCLMGDAARVVAIRSMTVGGQPYWAAADVAAYLDSAADNWATVGDADDVVPQSIAGRLRQLSVQLSAEAILQHDWWAGHRFGRPSPPAPGSSLPGGAKIGSAIKYELGERHLYFSAAGVTGFLHAEADRCLREHEQLFDRESAARMAARYLHATAGALDLESMLVTRTPSGREPMTGA